MCDASAASAEGVDWEQLRPEVEGLVQRQSSCFPPNSVCMEVLAEAEQWERSEEGAQCLARVRQPPSVVLRPRAPLTAAGGRRAARRQHSG